MREGITYKCIEWSLKKAHVKAGTMQSIVIGKRQQKFSNIFLSELHLQSTYGVIETTH